MAVYTKISAEQLAAFLSHYDCGALESFSGIEQGVDNSNYHVFTDRGHFILTIFESRIRPEDLPFFFAFTAHLHGKGINCPHALRDKGGGIFNPVGGRLGALVSFLEGESLTLADVTADHCAQLGGFVGRMHEAAADFPMQRANRVGLARWRELADETRARADEVEPGLAALIGEELDCISQHWPSENLLHRRVVHADIFPDNVFFQGGQVCGVLDFYFSCTEFLAYDLAITVNAWCFDANCNLRPERLSAFMESYQAARKIGESERGELRLMARAAALRILLTRLRAYLNRNPDHFVKTLEPRDYIERLKVHRHDDIFR
jgi:homoserine kinase type II